MDLSVVIPARNEAPNVAPLVAEIRRALDGQIDYEIVYVDDGSSDTTAAEIKRLAAQFPGLRSLRHQAACGQSMAILTGVKAARATGCSGSNGGRARTPPGPGPVSYKLKIPGVRVCRAEDC